MSVMGCFSEQVGQTSVRNSFSELSFPWGRETDEVTPSSPSQPYFVQFCAPLLECIQRPVCAEQFTCSVWQKSLNFLSTGQPYGSECTVGLCAQCCSGRRYVQCSCCLQRSHSWWLVRKKAASFTRAVRSLGSEWLFYILQNCLLWLSGD